jgi:hypothetical protein
MAIECEPIEIQLTKEQVRFIRKTLKKANKLKTDERQLLNGLLEMAEHHPEDKHDHHPAWRYMIPR